MGNREEIIRKTLSQGPAWEESSELKICRANAMKKQTRLGAKKVKQFEQLSSPGEVLCKEEATAYRALAARANDLALDRPDIAFAAKELCREFAQPTKSSYARLKRLARYLKGKPRLVWKFPYQDETSELTVFVDTDFAGCMKTRRSTSGGAALRGTHLIKAWSTTQTTVALSSGEAELSGIVKGSTQAIGLRSVAADLGTSYDLHLYTDATAAIGICRRRGLGKIRHLSVGDLWIQDKIKCRDFRLSKVLGTENPADLFTKHLDHKAIEANVKRLHLIEESGRAVSAPALPKSEGG